MVERLPEGADAQGVARLAEQGRIEEAAAAYERLGTGYDADEKLLRVIGEYYRETRAFDKAIPVYRKLVEMNPGDTELKRALVVLYFDKGDFDSAVKVLDGLPGEGDGSSPSAKVGDPVRIKACIATRAGNDFRGDEADFSQTTNPIKRVPWASTVSRANRSAPACHWRCRARNSRCSGESPLATNKSVAERA